MSADQTVDVDYSIDPFPEIPPALLNSADITRYARAGYLVTDFDEDRLKSAAYQIRFLGTLYSWENEQDALTEKEASICCEKMYTLPKNSITYLFTEEEFLLPEYIAARINFRIPFVHKGMLLGTGPLVDAGFQGSLLIPLHNLTSNDYRIRGGDPVIWAEFTKLSPHKYWQESCWEDRKKRPDDLVEFLPDKSHRNASEYLQKAEVTAKGGVQSAFKGALVDAQESAEVAHDLAAEAGASAMNAAAEAERIGKRYTLVGSIGAFIAIGTLVVAGVGVVIAAWQMNQSNNELATGIQYRLTDHAEDASPHSGVAAIHDVDSIRQELLELTRRVQELEEANGQTPPPP